MKNTEKIEIEKYCAYCEHSVPTYEQGIVSGVYKCRKFKYDPQKRKPTKKLMI